MGKALDTVLVLGIILLIALESTKLYLIKKVRIKSAEENKEKMLTSLNMISLLSGSLLVFIYFFY
jgi:hypothetical protein